MTLVVAVVGRDSVWMVSDRQLTWPNRLPEQDGIKTLCLQCKDGTAIVGYAGIGATRNRVQPSAWMNRFLRGKTGTVEQVLGYAARTMARHLGPHLNAAIPAHAVVAAAIVGNDAPRLYAIEFRLRANHNVSSQFQRRSASIGSGAQHVDRLRVRGLTRLVDAHDRGLVSTRLVRDAFAKLNFDVQRKDRFVGKRCVVRWLTRSGGGWATYDGLALEMSPIGLLPDLMDGYDLAMLLPALSAHGRALLAGESVDDAKLIRVFQQATATGNETLD